jgi:hypothetical protein
MTSYGATKKDMEQNLPKQFNGEKTELRRFLQETRDYMTTNKEMFDDDEEKIGFILSFMNEGEAGAWKEEFISRALNDADRKGEEVSLGSFEEFKKNFQKAFFPDGTPKNTHDDKPTPTQTKRPFLCRKKSNPDTKNTDRMSVEEQAQLMKEGRCFKCKKHGHRFRDCPPDKEPRVRNGISLADVLRALDGRPKKQDGRLVAIHIRDLIDGLDEEEKEKFREAAEEEGLDFC